MSKQYLVIGLGHFGYTVAKTLSEGGQEVLAIDSDESIVQKAHNEKVATHVVAANAIDEAVLEALGVNEDIDVAIVCIGEHLEISILATAILKEKGVGEIIAKASNEMHGKILKKIGADSIVLPEIDLGRNLARNLMKSTIFEELNFSESHSIIDIKTPKWMVGKSIKEAEIRKKFGANIVAIKSDTSLNVTPVADYCFKENDSIVLIIAKDRITKFENG